MGIVNRTPDSFYDGGRYLGDLHARARAHQLVREGADIVDIGAESTRPGAPAIAAAEQIARLGELVRETVALCQSARGPGAPALGVRVSIDTTSPEVATRALDDGASIINSVSLEPAAALARLALARGAELVLTHCRGAMTAMAGFSRYRDDGYGDIVGDVAREWSAAARLALDEGLPAERLLCDPGLGFAKNAAQSLALCRRLDELRQAVAHELGLADVRLLVGPSRKSYLAHAVAGVLGGELPPPEERLGSSIAAALDCVAQGAEIVRVHDVAVVRQALAYASALASQAPPPTTVVDGGAGA